LEEKVKLEIREIQETRDKPVQLVSLALLDKRVQSATPVPQAKPEKQAKPVQLVP
jgi:hypothetical protein